ncbi:MAG TPA: hypothetical protein PLZ43_12770, partial [bacterium]|nr:hypothetical protein [bacterium]
IWEDILIEIDKREVDFTEWLSKALHEKEPEVKEEFFIGLKNFPDPKKWWEEVFPALLKRRIQSLTKDFNSAISRKVAADSEQVADFTKQKFDCDIAINKQNIAMEKMEIDTNFENKPEIKGNLDRMKNISRLSSAGAFMGSMLLLPGAPIGMIISAMAGIYGEKVIKGKIEEQRSQVEKYVEDVVSEALDKMIKESKKQISKTYISIATNIKKEKSIWQNNIIKTFENINELDVTKQLAEIETKTEMFIELTKNMNGDRCD